MNSSSASSTSTTIISSSSTSSNNSNSYTVNTRTSLNNNLSNHITNSTIGIGLASFSSSTTPFTSSNLLAGNQQQPALSSVNNRISTPHRQNSRQSNHFPSQSQVPIQPSTNTTTITPTNYLITSSMPSSSTTTTSNILNLNRNPNIIQQQPSTSAVSSSSSSPISSAQNLSSTTRDWFTYVYKIDNIEELIRSNESSSSSSSSSLSSSSSSAGGVSSSSQQNFVQSQIFQFTNHIINTPNPANHSIASSSSANLSSASSSLQQQPLVQSSNIGGSGGVGVALNNCTSSHCITTAYSNTSNSNSSTNQSTHQLNSNANAFSAASNTTSNNNNTNNSNNTSGSIINSNTNSNKQASNWRLIFYPNGAGNDCKNFLSIFLKYLSDEPVKIQMMFSIVDNNNEDVYVKYTVNKFNKLNDWGFKQLIHKNAILYQKDKFLKHCSGTNGNGGSLSVRVKMRLDEQKHDYIKKLNDNLHYCKLLSENFSQYYYNNNSNLINESNESSTLTLASASASSSSSSNNNISQTNLTNSIDSCSSAALPAVATSSATAASSSSPFLYDSVPSLLACTDSSLPSSSFKPSSSATVTGYINHPGANTTNGTHPNGFNSSINSLNASQTSIFSNSTNSSYYDILLLVKSSHTTPLSNNGNKTNTQLCNDCIKNESQITCNSKLNVNNRRNYSSLFNSNTSSSISNNKEDEQEESNDDGELIRKPSSYYYNQPNNKRVKLSQPSQVDCYPVQSINMTDSMNCSNCGQSEIKSTSELIEFRAHKCILAARSPVFKAMFNYRLKENLTNKVIIEDCRPEVVKAMLKYIYTAYLPDDIRSIAIDLYIAAEKYFIESLKIKCREYLIENLNTESVIQIYILSELYNDSMLRKQSLKFISENIDKVTQNSDWNDFMTVYPQFYTNAFIRLCKKDF